MKKQFYPFFYLLLFSCLLLLQVRYVSAQTCTGITASYSVTESRCAATGAIQVAASGGSGNYLYRVLGPVTTNFSTSSLITGLPAGRYLAVIKDLTANCIYQHDSVTVPGSYLAPSFLMNKTDVTCIDGNDGTITVYNEQNGRSPFLYSIISPSASNVGVQNASGVFTNLLYGSYTIRLTDSCGGIQTRTMTILNYNWWIDSALVSRLCDSAIATIKLKDNLGNATPSTAFDLFTYAVVRAPGDTVWSNSNSFTFYLGNKRSVTLLAKDKCGNIKTIVWADNKKPSVNANVSISNMACSTFVATITSIVNFINPEFCLYNNSNVLLYCNNTGFFKNVPYGQYCIKINDSCYDTTITRCFTVNRPVPSVGANINISNQACSDFTAAVAATTNLNNPQFCLYNKNNVLMYCNTTGVFTNLAYGSYCIHITNDPACYDTTIIRCFTVYPPVPSANPNPAITNVACSTFTVTIGDTAHWNNAKFCLYDVNHVVIICNSTGVFTNLPFGTYCISITNDPGCYDTTMWRCFTVNRPVPSVSASVKISSKTCTTFTAEIQGQQNLNNAQYCLYNSSNVLISCNSSGKFTGLPYGSYCINITNNPACHDTVISRCFTVTPPVLQFALNAAKSCTAYGTTDITVNINSGTPSYAVTVLNDAGQVVSTTLTSSTTYKIYGLPDLPAPAKYTIIVIDQCGNTDTLQVAPNASVLTKKVSLVSKCPSGINPDGGADMNVTTTTNMGSVTPKIIKKNNSPFVLNYSIVTGNVFSFYELPPAVYVIEYSTTGCTIKLYDTVSIAPYVYPDLTQSRAYHCDSNTISIGAVATGGMAPYMYEIFQTVPALPSIITPPQPNPIFTFNNTTNYTLIRLRVIDGCGNASINDVSMQPLAPVLISPSNPFTCYYDSLTLSVDTIANAVYEWYHKTGPNDSVLVSTTWWYYIHAIQPADTGWYVCHVSVNNYCLNRSAYYHLKNMCGMVLPVQLQLYGSRENNANKLWWHTQNETGIKEYIIERSDDGRNNFKPVGSMQYAGNGTGNHYLFNDEKPLPGDNYYRLKVSTSNGGTGYSNIVRIKSSLNAVFVYPNPAQEQITVDLRNKPQSSYIIRLYSSAGLQVYNQVINNTSTMQIKINRNILKTGVYLVTITNTITGEQDFEKIIFR